MEVCLTKGFAFCIPRPQDTLRGSIMDLWAGSIAVSNLNRTVALATAGVERSDEEREGGILQTFPAVAASD